MTHSPGTLTWESVKCGNKRCRCATEQRFHKGLYLRYRDYAQGGKRRKRYVRRNEIVFYLLRVYLPKYNAIKNTLSPHDEVRVLGALTEAVEFYQEKYPQTTPH